VVYNEGHDVENKAQQLAQQVVGTTLRDLSNAFKLNRRIDILTATSLKEAITVFAETVFGYEIAGLIYISITCGLSKNKTPLQ